MRCRPRYLYSLSIAGLVLLVVGVPIVIIMLMYWHEGFKQDECRERGGRVVEVRGTRDNAWFCDERH